MINNLQSIDCMTTRSKKENILKLKQMIITSEKNIDTLLNEIDPTEKSKSKVKIKLKILNCFSYYITKIYIIQEITFHAS